MTPSVPGAPGPAGPRRLRLVLLWPWPGVIITQAAHRRPTGSRRPDRGRGRDRVPGQIGGAAPAAVPVCRSRAPAVAGAAPGVLRLVDCSLLSPPQAGPDGRLRYVMLERLRAYGAGQLAETGEQEQAEAALARYALGVAGQAAAGLRAYSSWAPGPARIEVRPGASSGWVKPR